MTVGYENSKFNKQSKQISDSKEPSPLLPLEKAQLKLKARNSLGAKRQIESDPLLIGFDEVEQLEQEQITET